MEQTNYPAAVNKLRAAREARGMSQEQLAAIIGVTDGSISNWETGRANPGAPACKLLALILGESEAAINGWFDREAAVA